MTYKENEVKIKNEEVQIIIFYLMIEGITYKNCIKFQVESFNHNQLVLWWKPKNKISNQNMKVISQLQRILMQFLLKNSTVWLLASVEFKSLSK